MNPFVFSHTFSFAEMILSLSSNRFPLSLLFIFSFPFKSLWVHVIFKFLARKSTGYLWKNPQVTYGTLCFAQDLLKQTPHVVEKLTRHLWNILFCILQFAAKNHRSWKNPPGTCGTNCFETRIFEAKSTNRGRLHQALVGHAVLLLTYSFQTCLHKQRTNPNIWSETR